MEIPSFFTDPQLLITYNYNQLSNLVDTDIDFYQYIDNLSIPLNKNKSLLNSPSVIWLSLILYL